MFKIRENDFVSFTLNSIFEIMIVGSCGMCSLILPDSAVYGYSLAHKRHGFLADLQGNYLALVVLLSFFKSKHLLCNSASKEAWILVRPITY